MRPSWSMAGRIMPLSLCGNGYSRKFPVTVIAGRGVDWIVAGVEVSMGTVFVADEFVSPPPHAASNTVRSSRPHTTPIFERRFIVFALSRVCEYPASQMNALLILPRKVTHRFYRNG